MSKLVQKVKWPLSGLPNMEMYMYSDASVEANKEMQEPLKKLYEYENQPDMKEIIAVQDNEDNYKCPVCGKIFTGSDIIKYSYRCCYNCGQRVDFTLPRNRINRDL